MSRIKRLRIVWAALTQDWRQETCPTCGDTWYAVTRATPSGLWCQTCEGKQFEVWHRDYIQRQQRKEIA